MKSLILIILIVHTTIATVDFQNIKNTAASKLQMLQGNAAMNLLNIQEQAATKLRAIQQKATESLQQLSDSIDLEKLQKLDILNILPTLQHKGKAIQRTVHSLPEYKKRVRFYLQRIKSLTGKDLVVAIDASVPWPAKRLDDERAIEIQDW